MPRTKAVKEPEIGSSIDKDGNVVYTFPKTMGACADRLYDLRAQRLAMSKEVGNLEAEEKALKDHIINTLPKSDTGAMGTKAKVKVIQKVIPQVEDWDALYKFIKRTGSFEFLQRRLGESAVNERWEANKPVPGVTKFHTASVSVTKL